MRLQIVLGKPDVGRSFSFPRLLSAPPALILISFSIIYLTVFQYYRHFNYRDPTSYFFDSSRAYKKIYSVERIGQVDAFMEAAGSSSPPKVSLTPPMMCVGVATVARRDEQYVRRTIGSVLEGLTDDERQSIYLDILVAHTDPTKHPIYSEKWIETLPNKVLGYASEDLDRVRTWEEGKMYRNKTIYDYTHLLRDCYATGARYITMLEDDVLAVKGWYPRALQGLKDIEREMARRPEGSKWLYMRVFFVEDLFGWNSQYWYLYLFWSLVLWVLVIVCLLGARSRSRTLQVHLLNTSIGILSCVCLPALIGLHFLAGRNSVSPLSPGIHEMNKFGCCSQGYIFPREIVPEFLENTDLETDWLVDMMVEVIADQEGYTRWATVPSLFQHIGTTSSKGHGFDGTAKNLWNFGFELHKVPLLSGGHTKG